MSLSAGFGQPRLQGDQGFGVADTAVVQRAADGGTVEQHGFDKLVFVGLQRAVGADIDGAVQVHFFVAEAGSGVELGEFFHALGTVGRLFGQLAQGADGGVFAGIEFAGGHFEQGFSGGVAPLAHQHHALVGGYRQHAGGAGVAHDYALGFVAVGQAHAVAADVDKAATVQGFASQRGFLQSVHRAAFLVFQAA